MGIPIEGGLVAIGLVIVALFWDRKNRHKQAKKAIDQAKKDMEAYETALRQKLRVKMAENSRNRQAEEERARAEINGRPDTGDAAADLADRLRR